ncbi:MAG: hypothetical protein ACYDIE_11095 [Candidatus Krumholzibacteriia bacterium]
MGDQTDAGTGRAPLRAGRFVAVVAALLLLAQCVVGALAPIHVSARLVSVAIGVLLGSELLWGSRWARWMVAAYMILPALPALVAVPWKAGSPLVSLLHGFFIVVIAGGLALLFHPQVAPYLLSRRERLTARQQRLRAVIRGVALAGMLVGVILNVWEARR